MRWISSSVQGVAKNVTSRKVWSISCMVPCDPRVGLRVSFCAHWAHAKFTNRIISRLSKEPGQPSGRVGSDRVGWVASVHMAFWSKALNTILHTYNNYYLQLFGTTRDINITFLQLLLLTCKLIVLKVKVLCWQVVVWLGIDYWVMFISAVGFVVSWNMAPWPTLCGTCLVFIMLGARTVGG